MNIEQRIIDLAPWALEVEVAPGITTAPAPRNDQVSFTNPKPWFTREVASVYPAGLAGKRFLDCACNCGAYSFWAKELGAAECFGFDVRRCWIDQAEFLLTSRTSPKDGMRFQRLDLLDLPGLGLPPFDITWFSGIFYHLPDPVTGLKIAADLTNEVLMLNTAWKPGPAGALIAGQEAKDATMAGVYGLNWHPTGPEVLQSILRWLGFVEFRLSFQNEKRIALWASKKIGLLKVSST
ncbi:MAG TPA: hypothetical protein VIK18_00900 [Pirellulales bacterium]